MSPSVVEVEVEVLGTRTQQLEEWLAQSVEGSPQKTALALAVAVAKGEYVCALQSGLLAEWLATADKDVDAKGLSELLAQRAASYADGNVEDGQWRQAAVLLVAVALLSYFAQNNWTGPAGEVTVENLLPEALKPSCERLSKEAVEQLESDGEDCYRLVHMPLLLLLAKSILTKAATMLKDLKTARWWCARAQFLHQQLLNNPAASLYQCATSCMTKVEEEQFTSFPDAQRRDLTIQAHVEHGIMLEAFNDIKGSMAQTQKAQQASGLRMQLTGALGRRTRFQQFDTAQLVLKARSEDVEDPAQSNGEASSRPINKQLDDDTLLEHIAFSEDVADQEGLALLDQCTILACCLNIKNTNPLHGLTTEEMIPYVQRVLKETNSHNWMVYSMALLLRSRLEAERSRTVERAVMQLQVLLDQFNDDLGKKEAPVSQRMKYFYSLAFPSIFGLQRELGQRYLSLGIAKSALELFERLEMWDEVIHCYQVIDDNKRALQVCQRELEKARTPQMLCVLGDLTKDKQCYIDAWELSGHHYARAMRSLGRMYLFEEKYAECVDCFSKSVAINPQIEGTWFSLGCAAMRLDDYSTAANAFRRCLGLNEENGEGWSNLGTCYIKLGDKAKAAHAIELGLKTNYDNWRIWENYLYVCCDLKYVQEIARAIHRIMDLKPEKFADVKLLRYATGEVIKQVEAAESQQEKDRLIKMWQETLGRVSMVKGTSADVWTILANWHEWQDNLDKTVDCLQRAYRVCQTPGWMDSVTSFTDVANRAITLTLAYFEQQSITAAHSARLMLRSLIKKTEEAFGDTPEHARMKELLAQAEQIEADLKQKAAASA
eukprot:comp17401_c0_seq1/m.16741 comp17401_c0_seq1/g.16741  ORF comp17401_c0_seq1/g.16741 comp17401_c0_seq1/m.16741 type:complete len:831 (-) comp17401_c0_seq1:40-2532(-)